ncbi:MAG: tyrosine-protein phosphatase [Proteobacteria bacterium]|nr:tyrosine-protein phosphatase [Pseudomonadota bacterium]
MMHNSERLLPFPALLNARDLGGYPTVDGAQTRWRSLLRSDDLAQLTAAGMQALRDYGVETVVDLRWAEEIVLNPSPLGAHAPQIRYVHSSLLASTPAQWRELAQGCEKEHWKCRVLEQVRPHVRDVLKVMAAASAGPLLFHCVAGKDRTGLIAALMLALADVKPEAIAADYAESSQMLGNAYLVRYKDVDPQDVLENVRCPEEGVHNMLAYLRREGGIRAYLERIGLNELEIARLRARLRD